MSTPRAMVLAVVTLAGCDLALDIKDPGVDTRADDTGFAAGSDVPDLPYCADVADWDEDHAALEEELRELVNAVRAEGGDCDGRSFGPAGPLEMSPALRCAARVHSADMVDRGFFDHQNPDGEGPSDRVGQAGYSFTALGENILQGFGSLSTAEEAVQAWLASPPHCENIHTDAFTETGVGYIKVGNSHTWTQVFGAPQGD